MTRAPHDAKWVGNVINVVMGMWLFASAFLWTHDGAAQTTTIVIGLVIAGFAVAALVKPELSWVDALPAWWLFTSALRLDHGHSPTPFNNGAVAVVVFLAALAPLAAAPPPQPGAPGRTT